MNKKSYNDLLLAMRNKDSEATIDKALNNFLSSNKEVSNKIKNNLFSYAVQLNDICTAKKLIEHDIYSNEKTETLMMAVYSGNIDMVKTIVKLYNLDERVKNKWKIETKDNLAFSKKEMQLLMHDVGDERKIRIKPLVAAATVGDDDIVKFILPYSDPKLNDSEPLYRALTNNNKSTAEILFDLSDVEKVRERVGEREGKIIRVISRYGGVRNIVPGHALLWFYAKIKSMEDNKLLRKEINTKTKDKKTKLI